MSILDFNSLIKAPVLDPERWVAIVHRGCGEKAFEINSSHITRRTRMVRSEWVKLPNGEKPKTDDPVVCGSCGMNITMSDIPPWMMLWAYEQHKHVWVD